MQLSSTEIVSSPKQHNTAALVLRAGSDVIHRLRRMKIESQLRRGTQQIHDRKPRQPPDTGSHTRPDARVETGHSTRPDARPDTRPDARPDTRPDTRLETGRETGHETGRETGHETGYSLISAGFVAWCWRLVSRYNGHCIAIQWRCNGDVFAMSTSTCDPRTFPRWAVGGDCMEGHRGR